MLIDNLRLRGREGLWQLRVADGRIAALVPMEQAADDAGERLDGAGGLAVPPFIEPHIHLDTTQTAGQPEWNRSGTLFEGIERWAQRKALLSHEDVKQRAWQTLKWQIANGVQHVRSHVDVSDPTLTALKAMLEVRGEVAPWVDLQIVAFPRRAFSPTPTAWNCWRSRCAWAPTWWGRSRISNSPASWASSRCTRPSTWPSATTCRWTCIATKSTTSSRASSRPWPCSPIATASAHGSPPATPRRCTPTTAPTPRGCSAC